MFVCVFMCVRTFGCAWDGLARMGAIVIYAALYVEHLLDVEGSAMSRERNDKRKHNKPFGRNYILNGDISLRKHSDFGVGCSKLCTLYTDNMRDKRKPSMLKSVKLRKKTHTNIHTHV